MAIILIIFTTILLISSIKEYKKFESNYKKYERIMSGINTQQGNKTITHSEKDSAEEASENMDLAYKSYKERMIVLFGSLLLTAVVFYFYCCSEILEGFQHNNFGYSIFITIFYSSISIAVICNFYICLGDLRKWPRNSKEKSISIHPRKEIIYKKITIFLNCICSLIFIFCSFALWYLTIFFMNPSNISGYKYSTTQSAAFSFLLFSITLVLPSGSYGMAPVSYYAQSMYVIESALIYFSTIKGTIHYLLEYR